MISPASSIRFRISRRSRARMRIRRRRYGVVAPTSNTRCARSATRGFSDCPNTFRRARFFGEMCDCSRKSRISRSYIRTSRLSRGILRHFRQIRARSPLPPNASFGLMHEHRMRQSPQSGDFLGKSAAVPSATAGRRSVASRSKSAAVFSSVLEQSEWAIMPAFQLICSRGNFHGQSESSETRAQGGAS